MDMMYWVMKRWVCTNKMYINVNNDVINWHQSMLTVVKKKNSIFSLLADSGILLHLQVSFHFQAFCSFFGSIHEPAMFCDLHTICSTVYDINGKVVSLSTGWSFQNVNIPMNKGVTWQNIESMKYGYGL